MVKWGITSCFPLVSVKANKCRQIIGRCIFNIDTSTTVSSINPYFKFREVFKLIFSGYSIIKLLDLVKMNNLFLQDWFQLYSQDSIGVRDYQFKKDSCILIVDSSLLNFFPWHMNSTRKQNAFKISVIIMEIWHNSKDTREHRMKQIKIVGTNVGRMKQRQVGTKLLENYFNQGSNTCHENTRCQANR